MVQSGNTVCGPVVSWEGGAGCKSGKERVNDWRSEGSEEGVPEVALRTGHWLKGGDIPFFPPGFSQLFGIKVTRQSNRRKKKSRVVVPEGILPHSAPWNKLDPILMLLERHTK